MCEEKKEAYNYGIASRPAGRLLAPVRKRRKNSV
jgi:hypothetical protein